MKGKRLYHFLDSLLQKAYVIPEKHEKLVIFSDLHMGDGSSKDDFVSNSQLFSYAAKEYYFQKDFTMILNGDIEELQRFALKKITATWDSVFEIFDQFQEKGKLFKTIGNHDLAFADPNGPKSRYPLYEVIKIPRKKGDFFLFHGHQVASKYIQLNKLVGLGLKYFANPLRITNYSVSHDSVKQYQIEKKVYHYSSYRKIASIIGHTHRPLFESLSKPERIRHEIELLCRNYTTESNEANRKEIRKTLKSRQKELKKIIRKERFNIHKTHLYNDLYHLPCLFNSGCVIGKRGITCLEITKNEIALVHWFDESISKRYLKKRGYEPEAVGASNYHRMVLNKEDLNYIFTRIKLLGG